MRLPPLRESSQSSTISSLAPSICDVHDPVRSEAATDKVPEVFTIHDAPQSSPGYVCGRGEWGVRMEAAMDELVSGGELSIGGTGGDGGERTGAGSEC